jgi:CheY-like chemotaxis protein
VVPEILIVGDPNRRRDLIDSVRECHYDVTLCAARELNRRIRSGPSPGAIIVAMEDAEATLLLTGLRRSRQGAAVPVILFGRLGGEIRDLADVLDLGADHFLEDPFEFESLSDVLMELAGPASGRTETQIDAEVSEDSREKDKPRERRTRTRESRGVGMVTERLEETSSAAQRGSEAAPEKGKGRQRVLGQLHQTLDRLEARLRDRDDEEVEDEEDEGSEISLDAMGLGDIPELADEDNDELDSGEFELLDEELEEDENLDDGRQRRRSDRTEPRVPERGVDERSAVLRGRRPPRRRERDATPTTTTKKPRRPSVPSTGSLEDVDVPTILWRLHQDQFSGRVTVQRGRAQKQIWLLGGEVSFVRSNLSSDRFVDGLLRRGVLTRPQYETARRLAAKQPSRAGRLLVEAGFVKPREMHRLLQDHLTRVLDATFGWTDGSWNLQIGDAVEEKIRVETPMAVMLLEGVRFRLETDDIRERLGQGAVCPRLKTDGSSMEDRAQHAADALRVLPEEEAWLLLFDGKNTLDDLLNEAAGDDHSMLALIYVLVVLDHVELIGEPEPEGAGENADQIDANRIVDRLRMAREADYFQLLGLDRDASRSEVRRAYSEVIANFQEHNLEPTTRERFSGELDELRTALVEARDVLCDDAIRSAYLAHLGDA